MMEIDEPNWTFLGVMVRDRREEEESNSICIALKQRSNTTEKSSRVLGCMSGKDVVRLYRIQELMKNDSLEIIDYATMRWKS